MKKKTILIIIIFIFVVFMNVGINKAEANLANVEVLASEISSSLTLSCYDDISDKGTGNRTHVTYCGGCSAKLARSWSSTSSCAQ